MNPLLTSVIAGRCPLPFEVLGAQPMAERASSAERVVRAFLSWAESIELITSGGKWPMARIAPEGLFEVRPPPGTELHAYQFRVKDSEGREFVLHDPYRFAPVIDENEWQAFAEGSERRAYRLLGARSMAHDGVDGTCFAVWAPRARNVNLMGEFNRWDARCHPMRLRGTSGVWELFVPGVGHLTHYKFEIRLQHSDSRLEKADPFGRAMELRPQTASMVWDSGDFAWTDAEWMDARSARQGPESAVAIYEVHLGSWRRKPDADPRAGRPGWFTYRELAAELLPYVKQHGFTHVELLPINEHPLDKSWGYQNVGYFAPTARYGTPDDLRYFVDRAHQLGIGVLADWVPAHFPRDAHGLAVFDGRPLYEYADPRLGAHPDWGTLVFDYGRPEVVSFLTSSALYWLEEFHFDGLRVDAVASMLYRNYSRKDGEWIPNKYGGPENLEAVAFLRSLNDAIHEESPGVLMVAEESTSWPKVSHSTADGGLGFDLKWDMGWMNDVLSVMSADPIYRKAMYDKLTFAIWYASTERFLLPLSHDEVVHMKRSLLGKMPGTMQQQLANLRLLLAFMWAHPGKKLLFMGGEIGQPTEWNHEAQLRWDVLEHAGHAGVQSLVGALNRLYHDQRALRELDLDPSGFEWLDCHDAARTTLAFIRWAKGWQDPVIVAANFTPVVWTGYQLPVPFEGQYRVVLNTAGSDFGADPVHEVPGVIAADESELHGRDYSVTFDLPPLAVVYFTWKPDRANAKSRR